MTEGQVYAARRNPATPVDHNAPAKPGLVSRLRLQRGRRASRTTASSATIACWWCAPASIPAFSTRPRPSSRTCCATRRQPSRRIRRRRSWRTPTASCGRWSAGRDYGGEPVQPRHRSGAPAGLVVQDFCLPDRPDDGQISSEHAGQRGRRLHRRLLRPQLSQRERRHDADDDRAGAIVQHRGDLAFHQDRRSLLAAEAALSRRQDRLARPVEDRRDGAHHGTDDAAARHRLAAGRRRRSQDDRHGRRQRHAGQWRQARDALRRDRNPQFRGQADLHP